MLNRVNITAMVLGVIMILALTPNSALAQMGPASAVEEHTAQTASYRIKIRMGPKVTMAMTSMTVTDQGNPVNRHLEVHIFNRSTGAEVQTVVPVVRVTNQTTGTSRQLTNLTACRVSRHLETEPHFGDNVYLPDGTYTITVVVGPETAVFRNLVLKASN